ncbi:MAG: pentapeptide repeat-containing protein, partial [Thermodesulfobacteriota bacterium]
MPKFEIKNRKTGTVIFSGRAGSLKELVQSAATAGLDGTMPNLILAKVGIKKAEKVKLYNAALAATDLSEIDLTQAVLSGSDLTGSDLSGSDL